MAELGHGGLAAWVQAGLIDQATADRIRAFEAGRAERSGRRWPVWLALAFGALMLAAGVLLFVSANWDQISPASRFALVLLMVGAFHVGGAFAAGRFEALAVTLHALGTVALGAGIFLAGQIFNLDEHWPAGVMLWAIGAWLGWFLRRDWPQLALVAVLTPAWLESEWFVRAGPGMWQSNATAAGLFLLSLAYLTAERQRLARSSRRTLFWLGAVALLPQGISLATSAGMAFSRQAFPWGTPAPAEWQAVAWSIAIAGPLVVAAIFRGQSAWLNAVAALWVVALVNVPHLGHRLWLYPWLGVGAASLAVWGVLEARTALINMGTLAFGLTVLVFYFDTVMDKMGRSASLIVLGLLFLGGGYLLERARRTLLGKLQGGQP